MNEYEQVQLRLIGQSYLARGFDVVYEVLLDGINYRFDAIAKDKSGEITIIEIVNKRQNRHQMQRRLEVLTEVAAAYPGAKVDFRYIDVGAAGLGYHPIGYPIADRPPLGDLLRARLPQFVDERGDCSRPFITMWLLHVAQIRAYGVSLGWPHAGTDNILELYNEMLRNHQLAAPQNHVAGLERDFFEMYEEALAALQGALIRRDACMQLRKHVLDVRRQIRNSPARHAERSAI